MFDDADPAKAAEAIAIAGYFNAGQDCTAATRVLAGPRIHDDFAAALVEQAASAGDRGPGRRGRRLRAAEQRQPAGPGDRVHLRGCPTTPRSWPAAAGSATAATSTRASVVDGLQQDDEIIQNEVFGPVITVQQFSDEDEALRWANGTRVRAGIVGLDV